MNIRIDLKELVAALELRQEQQAMISKNIDKEIPELVENNAPVTLSTELKYKI